MSNDADSEKDEGNEAFRRGDYATALKYYDKAIKNAGNAANAVLFSNKAAALLRLQRYDACIQQCLKGLAAPELTAKLKSKIYFRMGNAYESQEKFAEAMEAFGKCDSSPQVLEKTTDMICKLTKGHPDAVESVTSFFQAASANGQGDTAAITALLERLATESGDRSQGIAQPAAIKHDGSKQSRFVLELEHSVYVENYKVEQEKFKNLPAGMVVTTNQRVECADSGHICIAPLCDLETITIGQMRLHEVNVGKVLICRTIAEPFMMNAVKTLIEDPKGEATRLAVYNICLPNEDLSTVLPAEVYLAIKEPWYKTGARDGKRILRVDNPADIVYLEQTHPLLKNLTWRFDTQLCGPDSWESFQKRGNEFFVARNYELARVAYTDAIELKRKVAPLELADLFANRASAYLGNEKPPEALSDCEAALKLKPDHLKATFRFAKAFTSLRKYAEAKQVLTKSPHTTRPEFKTEIARLNRLLREQESGDYDLKSLLKEATESKTPRLDHANYSAGVEVKFVSAQKGNGLVALRDFAPGDLLFVEKAFEAVYTEESGIGFCFKTGETRYNEPSQNECLSRIIRRISKNPADAKELGRLYAGGAELKRFQADESWELCAIDSKRAAAIVSFNSFGCNDLKLQALKAGGDPKSSAGLASPFVDGGLVFGGCGVWILASFMNHSCVPNTVIFYAGDLMLVRAAKRIRRGEEITTSYICTTNNYPKRQESLKKFGFKCCCELCVCDEQRGRELPDLDVQRDAFMDMFNSTVNPRLRAAVQYHSKQIAKLVDDDRNLAEEFSGRLAYKNRYDHQLSRLYAAVGYGYNVQRQWSKAAKFYELAYFAVVGDALKPDATFVSLTIACDLFFDCYNVAGNYLNDHDLTTARKYLGKLREAAKIAWGSADQELLKMIYPGLPLENLFDI